MHLTASKHFHIVSIFVSSLSPSLSPSHTLDMLRPGNIHNIEILKVKMLMIIQ